VWTSQDVDIVYIATPHPFHFACGKMALEASKNILIEKVFAQIRSTPVPNLTLLILSRPPSMPPSPSCSSTWPSPRAASLWRVRMRYGLVAALTEPQPSQASGLAFSPYPSSFRTCSSRTR
jgi:hypothetical protein